MVQKYILKVVCDMQGVANHFFPAVKSKSLSIKIEYNQKSRQAHYYILDAFYLKRNDGLVSNLKEHINNFFRTNLST